MQCRGGYCEIAIQAQEGWARCSCRKAPETPKGAYGDPKVSYQGQVFDIPDNIAHKRTLWQLHLWLSQKQSKSPGWRPLNLLPSFHEVSCKIRFVQGGCGAVDNEPGGSRGVC
jgi:hypothetical protein